MPWAAKKATIRALLESPTKDLNDTKTKDVEIGKGSTATCFRFRNVYVSFRDSCIEVMSVLTSGTAAPGLIGSQSSSTVLI